MMKYRQKAQNILLPYSFLLLFLVLIPCFGSFCQDQHQSGEETKIDSLIRVIRINEKTILVSFGADAITAINTRDGIVVIDAGISTGLTSKYWKIIETEFQSDDFRYVINTHGHHDHTRGNRVFSEAKIIGHENAIEEIARQNESREKAGKNLKKIADEYVQKLQQYAADTDEWNENFTQKWRCSYAWEDIVHDITIKQPDITFKDSLYINLKDITIELFYFGRCHSASDILIYIPELQLLFTGDLFFKYGRPSVNDPAPEKDRWQASVNWIEKRTDHIETVISGHGEILREQDLELFNTNILTTGNRIR